MQKHLEAVHGVKPVCPATPDPRGFAGTIHEVHHTRVTRNVCDRCGIHVGVTLDADRCRVDNEPAVIWRWTRSHVRELCLHLRRGTRAARRHKDARAGPGGRGGTHRACRTPCANQPDNRSRPMHTQMIAGRVESAHIGVMALQPALAHAEGIDCSCPCRCWRQRITQRCYRKFVGNGRVARAVRGAQVNECLTEVGWSNVQCLVVQGNARRGERGVLETRRQRMADRISEQDKSSRPAFVHGTARPRDTASRSKIERM